MYVCMHVCIYVDMSIKNISPRFYNCYINNIFFLDSIFLNLILSYLGKSILLEYIAKYAIENGYNVCISAPTGKLAARYASRLPECRCNTVHSNFYIPVNNDEHLGINWSLADVHILIVDEVYLFFLMTLTCVIQFSFILHCVTS